MEEKKNNITVKLGELLSEYVELDGGVNPQMSLANDIGIDSFSLVCLVGNIEETFNINIPTEILNQFQTLSDMVDYIAVNSDIV